MNCKSLIIILFGILTVTLAHTQICDGNLGVNIFIDGDFGSGSANIPPDDPGIAPGYTYTTNPPPNDGFYCLTNNIATWNQVWGWSNIGDNSNDPNGYMMVVNASFSPGLFYEETVEGLCENTLFEFSADLRNLHNGANIIKPNVSFLIDDVEIYSSGDIPENNEWITHGFTFITNPGQTTVKLSLRNNAPGGIGNDLAIDNISFQACGPEALILPTTIANICEDGSPIVLDATVNGDQYDTPQYQWQISLDEGITWNDIPGANNAAYAHTGLAGGFYYYRYLLANDPANLANNKCQVVSNEKVIHVIPKFTDLQDSLCEGSLFYLGDKEISTSGIFVDTLQNFLGCDSIITLDLTIVPDSEISSTYSFEEPLCSNTADGTIYIDEISGAIPPFDVYFDGFLVNSKEVNSLISGDYAVQIIDRYGCEQNTMVTLPGPDPYIIDLGEDQSVDLGEEITLQAMVSESTVAFSWISMDPLSCSNCDEQNWTPTNSGWVVVDGQTEKGCIDRDSVYIEVRKSRKIYFPNSFTPNGDNINDRYTIFPVAPNVQSIDTWNIFDRWGNLVMARNEMDPSQDLSWDGVFNGRPLSSGIYSYYADITFLDGETIRYKGNISLVR